MNKKLILNLITLIITAFLLIFVINAWYVSNSTANVNNVTGETANDGFTLDLERGTYINYANDQYNWTWTSTKDLSINNMQPGDKFFFRFKVVPSKVGTYRTALGNISSSIQTDANDKQILTRTSVGNNYYVTMNQSNLYQMDNSTALFVYEDKAKTKQLGTLYTYTNNKFDLVTYKVENVFRFYNLGKGTADYGKDDTIPSQVTGVALNAANYSYTITTTAEFYIYFALEFNEAASEVTYLHQDNIVRKDSNLYLAQVLKIGQFELVFI